MKKWKTDEISWQKFDKWEVDFIDGIIKGIEENKKECIHKIRKRGKWENSKGKNHMRIQSLLEKIQQIKIIIQKGKAGLIEHNEIKFICSFTPQENLKCGIIFF